MSNEAPTTATRRCSCGWSVSISGVEAEDRAEAELAAHTCCR